MSKGEAWSTAAQIWWAGNLLLVDQRGDLDLGTLPSLQLVELWPGQGVVGLNLSSCLVLVG